MVSSREKKARSEKGDGFGGSSSIAKRVQSTLLHFFGSSPPAARAPGGEEGGEEEAKRKRKAEEGDEVTDGANKCVPSSTAAVLQSKVGAEDEKRADWDQEVGEKAGSVEKDEMMEGAETKEDGNALLSRAPGVSPQRNEGRGVAEEGQQQQQEEGQQQQREEEGEHSEKENSPTKQVGTTESGGPAEVDYEAEREARILANRERLMQLGLLNTMKKMAPKVNVESEAKNATVIRTKPPPRPVALPSRRSKRLRDDKAERKNMAEVMEDKEEAEEAEVELMESDVHRYVCETERAGPSLVREAPLKVEKLGRLNFSLLTPQVKGIYSITSSSDAGLVAVGGKGGFASLFGIGDIADTTKVEPDEEMTERETVVEPLMTFRAHRGWLADLRLGERNKLLLTAGNDGSIAGYDIMQIEKGTRAPRHVFEECTLHTSGIFSLDLSSDSVLTASKDGSSVLSRLSPAGPVMLAKFIAHKGVVKCARFQDARNPGIFADCGNDAAICIHDARTPESSPTPLTLLETHKCAINTLVWSPKSEHLLMSTSFGPDVLLHDIRHQREPLLRMSGHVPLGRNPKGIYNAVFMHHGRIAVCAGEGSGKLSVYCTDNGRALSRGEVGFNSNHLHVWSHCSSEILLAGHSCNTAAFVGLS